MLLATIPEPFSLPVLLLTVAAFLAGLVDAIAGGGGLLTLPSLLAAGLPPELALGTNKGQSVWGSGAALRSFWSRGLIAGDRAAWLFPAGFVGALCGVELVLHVDRTLLRPIVIGLLLVAATAIATYRPPKEETASAPRGPSARWLALAIALSIGFYDGFFGPGTGTFLIVLMVAVLKDDLLRATANAKVVNFASNLASVLWFAHAGKVVWHVALPMAVGQLAGGTLGAGLAVKEGQQLVRKVTLAVVAALIIKLSLDLVG